MITSGGQAPLLATLANPHFCYIVKLRLFNDQVKVFIKKFFIEIFIFIKNTIFVLLFPDRLVVKNLVSFFQLIDHTIFHKMSTFHKNAQISIKQHKTKFERFFSTPGDGIFVQNSIFYKIFLSENFHKNAQISIY